MWPTSDTKLHLDLDKYLPLSFVLLDWVVNASFSTIVVIPVLYCTPDSWFIWGGKECGLYPEKYGICLQSSEFPEMQCVIGGFTPGRHLRPSVPQVRFVYHSHQQQEGFPGTVSCLNPKKQLNTSLMNRVPYQFLLSNGNAMSQTGLRISTFSTSAWCGVTCFPPCLFFQEVLQGMPKPICAGVWCICGCTVCSSPHWTTPRIWYRIYKYTDTLKNTRLH